MLVGYDEHNYIFNDPQDSHALTYYSKDAVEAAYIAEGLQALIIVEKEDPSPRPPEESENPEEPIDGYKLAEELDKIDRSILMKTNYYATYYNSKHTETFDAKIPDDFNDYNILACLQFMYIYFCDQQDYEKTDFLYDEMLRVRKSHPNYKNLYKKFLDSNGQFDLGYEYYAPGRKTTKIEFQKLQYFTKDKIIQMNKADDWVGVLALLIPGVGSALEFLYAIALNVEQNNEIQIPYDILKNGCDITADKLLKEIAPKLGILGKGVTALSTLSNVTNTIYSTIGEEREVYNYVPAGATEGVSIRDGDSYIMVRLYYDMGVEYHQFEFYFRDGCPMASMPQYTVRLDDDPRGIAATEKKYEQYSEEGYVPSENHMLRGEYWPPNRD